MGFFETSMLGVTGDLTDFNESWRVSPGTVAESLEMLRVAVGLVMFASEMIVSLLFGDL